MLENIKTFYFTKLIFLHFDEEIKLDILKYNKSWQKKFDISLINYKIFSNNYIVYDESNVKGKEYDNFNNIIIRFEGEFKNGKRNGKGKEYNYHGVKIFEGEYFNGRRWNVKTENEGKIYELKDGKGYTKETIRYFYLQIESEFKNGKRNGKGKEYDRNGVIFEGEYFNGKRWNGKIYYLNNQSELKDGKGFIIEKNIYNYNKIEGNYFNGRMNGKVKEYYDDRLEFEGQYINGKRNGKGKEYWKDKLKLKFDGEYLNGKRIGIGKEYYNSELKFEGEYLNGKRNGKGKEYYDDKIVFEGEYLDGEIFNGKGKNYDFYDGKFLFEGEYLNGKRFNGKG